MKEFKLNDVVTIKVAIIGVGGVFENEFEGADGTKRTATSAHLKQERIAVYPSRNLGTGFGSGLFDNQADGKEYPSERHCLVAIPNGTSEEDITAQVGKFENATIYRILSNNIHDVIGDKNQQALENGLTDLDTLKARLVVQDGDGVIYASYTKNGQKLEGDDRKIGTIIKDDNNKTIGMEITNEEALLEYKVDVFSREFAKDVDKRQFVNTGTAEEVVEEAKEEIQA